MRSKRYRGRMFIMLLIASMSYVVPVMGKDYANHWAEKTIDGWATSNIILGDGEGNFIPDGQVTRAELAAFIDRLFGYGTPDTPRSYEDIEMGAWYEISAIEIASRGIMYLPGNYFEPAKVVTREEVAYAMAKAYTLNPVAGKEVGFGDSEDIANWALDSIQALAQAGYLNGYPNGSFRPKAPITRAEFMTLMDKMTSDYIYEPGERTGMNEENVIIHTGGVTLRDSVIEGNLYLVEGIGEGDIILEDVVVKGNLYIKGGKVVLSGDFNGIEIETKELVAFKQGTAKQISIVEDGTNVYLHKGTTTEYLLIAGEGNLKVEGIVKKSSKRELESLGIESAGVYINGVFTPVEVIGNTAIINLPKLIAESNGDIMEELIINTNKEDVYLKGPLGGKMHTNRRYVFRRADYELGIMEEMLQQVGDRSQELKRIIDATGATSDTVFGMLAQDTAISLRYMMSQYNSVKEMVYLFTGITLEDSYTFKRELCYKDEKPIMIEIRLQMK